MQFTTAKNYLILTERLGDKPMLRTRFISQSYFVFGAILDLISQGVITVSGSQITISDQLAFDQLPKELQIFKDELLKAGSAKQIDDAFRLVTSWDIASALYDYLGKELLDDKQAEKVTFAKTLSPHIIYVPTDEIRKQTTEKFRAQVSGNPDKSAISLLIIYSEMNALRFIYPDENQRETMAVNFTKTVGEDPFYQQSLELVRDVKRVIMQKKFWFDSWLS